MDDLITFIHKLESVKDNNGLTECCEKLCENRGIPFYILAVFYPYSMQRNHLLYISNFPEAWLNYYFEKELKKVDPVVIHSWESSSPILWQSIPKDPRFDNWKYQEVMSMAADVHLMDGVSVPIYGAFGGVGVLTFSSDKSLSPREQYYWMATALTIAPFLHTAVLRINLSQNNQTVSILTKRERECLLWACEGKTSWEISTIINISERTVNFHLNSSIKKLGCSNRNQAIAKALISGLIKPEI